MFNSFWLLNSYDFIEWNIVDNVEGVLAYTALEFLIWW